MANEGLDAAREGEGTDRVFQKLLSSTRELTRGAGGFASVMTQAFKSSIADGKQFDDVLKSLALKISNATVASSLKPLGNIFAMGAGGLPAAFGQLLGGIKPFASGGVIGSPTYFPLPSGGTGLAGEAGPEAIMPLRRGPDGRLGVAASGGGGNSIVVNIATPDADSFRRSDSYVAGQIARAVARGQRSL